MRGRTPFASEVGGWLVACGLGLPAGYLVGLGMTEGCTHAAWPASAGLALGVAGALAAPARRVLVALGGGGVAVVTAVTTIVAVQLERGSWPITDELTIAHHGSATQATLRAAVLLGGLIGVPCLIAAALVAVAMRRRVRREPGSTPDPTHEPGRPRSGRYTS